MANYPWNQDRGMRDPGWAGNIGPRSGGEYRAERLYGYDYGYRTGNRAPGYDRDMYDRNYKSDWQTAQGDPFGDRQRGTPVRAMEGSFKENFKRNRYGYDHGTYGAASDRQRYDRSWFGNDTGNRYDRGWLGTGIGSSNRYDSGWFGNRSNTRYDSGFFGNRSARGYDRGVFGTRTDRQRTDPYGSSPNRNPQRYDSSWW